MSIKSADSKESITCPLCHEEDYDKVGLKAHLELFCDEYKKVEYK